MKNRYLNIHIVRIIYYGSNMVTLLNQLRESADKFHNLIRLYGHLIPTAKEFYDNLCHLQKQQLLKEIHEAIVNAKIDRLSASDDKKILIDNFLIEAENEKLTEEIDSSITKNEVFPLFFTILSETNSDYTNTIINEINSITLPN